MAEPVTVTLGEESTALAKEVAEAKRAVMLDAPRHQKLKEMSEGIAALFRLEPDLAGPLMLILAVQTVALALFAVFVTFRTMGRNYDAAVLAAGHCGFGMGATPTAIAHPQLTITRPTLLQKGSRENDPGI